MEDDYGNDGMHGDMMKAVSEYDDDDSVEGKAVTVTCPSCGKKFSASNAGGASVGGAAGGGGG